MSTGNAPHFDLIWPDQPDTVFMFYIDGQIRPNDTKHSPFTYSNSASFYNSKAYMVSMLVGRMIRLAMESNVRVSRK